MNRSLGLPIALALTALLAGCADLANLVTPAGPVDTRPARVAFTASVLTATSRATADVVTLRVTTSYVLADGRRDTIGTQTLTLTSAASQAVPIPVDLAGCLADSNREGASAGAGCSVVLELALKVNDGVVDRQVVGPLRLSPGATTEVSQPVAMFEIASVSVTPAPSLAMTLGGTSNVTASIKDSRGQTVPDRTVVWSSDAPSIATVDGTGKVTAVAVGQARISATLGALSSSVLVQVARPPVSLVISPATGTGAGVVRSAPAGIDCRIVAGGVTGVCAFDFAAEAQVTLTSTADAGQQFSAWGGACAGSAVGANCTLTMAQARTASAQFSVLRRVTIASMGTDGRGRVTGGLGIDCRIDGAVASGACAVDVPDGSQLTLTSVADAASAGTVAQLFAGWGSDCASAAGATCTLSATGGNRIAGAGFNGGKVLTVSLDGAGGGIVTTTGGLSCARSGNATSGTCVQTLSHGTTVTLVPQADAQSDFAGWTGPCANQLANCTLVLSQARTVNASFSRRRVTLTMILSGSGNGAVKLNGLQVCDRTSVQVGVVTCLQDFEMGTSVSFVAAAGAVSSFTGNAGDCIGTTACTLVMNGPRSVTSTFSSTPSVTLTVSGLGAGSGVIRSSEAVPLINCTVSNGQATGPGCSTTVMQGTPITLRATGSANNALTAWGDSCVNRATYECALVLNASTLVSSGFSPAIDVELRLSGTASGRVTFEPQGAPSQAPCAMPGVGVPASCRFALPVGTEGVFRGIATTGLFFGFVGLCDESTGTLSVQVCTYRGIGFLRIINASFMP